VIRKVIDARQATTSLGRSTPAYSSLYKLQK
jgi:hypothetical protein